MTVGFGMAPIKMEGYTVSYADGFSWYGHVDEMNETCREYCARYPWPIKSLVKKVFMHAWQQALEVSAREKKA